MDKNVTVVFRHWTAYNTGGWRLREGKQMREIYSCISRQKCREEKPKQSPRSHPKVREESWEFREVKVTRTYRAENQRGEGCISFPTSLSWLLSAHACEENSRGQGKEPLGKNRRRSFSQASHRAGNSSHSPQPEPRNLMVCGHWLEYSEEYCLGNATKLAPDYGLCWSQLVKIKCKPGEKESFPIIQLHPRTRLRLPTW